MTKTESRKKNPLPKWKKWLIGIGIAGNILAVWLLLTALLDKVVMPIATRHNSEREAPDLFELTLEEAAKTAQKAGFRVMETEKRFDPNHAPGTVIEQFPTPFTICKRGRKIGVVTSSGEQLIPIPDVVGIPGKEAVFKMEAQGFEIARINRIFSDYYPKDVTAGQSMPPDTELIRGSGIGLTISRGPLPKKFIVPELYALEIEKARELIESAGLALGNVEEISHPHAAKGLVVKQFPKPGVEVEYLTRVNLKISSGQD